MKDGLGWSTSLWEAPSFGYLPPSPSADHEILEQPLRRKDILLVYKKENVFFLF